MFGAAIACGPQNSDNMRALATVEKLMCRDRTPDEDALLKMLTNAD
jgi:hypothetical protein